MDLSGVSLPPPTSANSSSTGLLAAGEAPAGIHCANPDCRTRAGERSRGHQSCRALLCGHCCQSAAKAAAGAGEKRPVCKVHARRQHTGHRPLPKEHIPQQPQPHPQPHPQPQSQSQPQPQPQAKPLPQMHPQHHSLHIESPVMFEPAPDFQDLLEKRARLEQSLKRSLTLVIWYRVCFTSISLS